MWCGRECGQPAGLQQRLLISAPRGTAARGRALLEWTLATALGMLLAVTSIWLYAQLGQVMKSLFLEHAHEQDLVAMMHVLRSELRIAGQRDQPGASSPHDALWLDEGKTLLLQYLCDRCGSPDRAHASGFRLQDGVMGHRSLGATAHQALHDPWTVSIRRWRITQGQSPDCSAWITVQLEGEPTSSARMDWVSTVRPRNLGLLDCEHAGTNAPSSPAVPDPSKPPPRMAGGR